MLNSIKAKLKKEYYLRVKKIGMEAYKQMLWREQGMKIGNNVHIYSDIISKEPYMISIDDNTTVSGDVLFVTHDNSISKYLPQYTDTFGEINIGKNCFIGMRSTILEGITLADNTIVASGAVVTKSFLEEGCVIGGCPAKIIGKVSDLKVKNEVNGFNIRGLSLEEKKKLLLSNQDKLVVR